MAAEFSLNTQMYLLSKKSLWLSDGSMGFGQESDVAFAEGTTLQMRGPLSLSALVSVVLCFIELMFALLGKGDSFMFLRILTEYHFGRDGMGSLKSDIPFKGWFLFWGG